MAEPSAGVGAFSPSLLLETPHPQRGAHGSGPGTPQPSSLSKTAAVPSSSSQSICPRQPGEGPSPDAHPEKCGGRVVVPTDPSPALLLHFPQEILCHPDDPKGAGETHWGGGKPLRTQHPGGKRGTPRAKSTGTTGRGEDATLPPHAPLAGGKRGAEPSLNMKLGRAYLQY